MTCNAGVRFPAIGTIQRATTLYSSLNSNILLDRHKGHITLNTWRKCRIQKQYITLFPEFL